MPWLNILRNWFEGLSVKLSTDWRLVQNINVGIIFIVPVIVTFIWPYYITSLILTGPDWPLYFTFILSLKNFVIANSWTSFSLSCRPFTNSGRDIASVPSDGLANIKSIGGIISLPISNGTLIQHSDGCRNTVTHAFQYNYSFDRIVFKKHYIDFLF